MNFDDFYDKSYTQELVRATLGKRFAEFKFSYFLLSRIPLLANWLGLYNRYDLTLITRNGFIDPPYPDRNTGMLQFFPEFAKAYGLTTPIDWSGEYEEHDLVNFINRRLATLDEEPLPEKVIKTLKKELILKQHKRGEFIHRQFQIIGESLKERKIDLTLLRDGSDQHYPFVFNESTTSKLPVKPEGVLFGCFSSYDNDA